MRTHALQRRINLSKRKTSALRTQDTRFSHNKKQGNQTFYINESKTIDFAQAIINNFGKKPTHNPKPDTDDIANTCTVYKLKENPMLESLETEQEKIVGVDMFIESNEQPNAVAEKCLEHGKNIYNLVTISNRGTQVWPTGSVFTNLINQYRCRFESIDSKALSQQDIINLYSSLSKDFKVCSLELLNMWNGSKAYSLAQGQ
jgi:isocitrate dehydrogenase